MTSTNSNVKRTKIKVGDVIEVSMQFENKIPVEDEKKSVIDLSNYPTRYDIHYSCPKNEWFSFLDFTVEAGSSVDFDDDIKIYLEKYLKEDVTEIAEFELFDIDNTGAFQSAKIEIKSIAEI